MYKHIHVNVVQKCRVYVNLFILMYSGFSLIFHYILTALYPSDMYYTYIYVYYRVYWEEVSLLKYTIKATVPLVYIQLTSMVEHMPFCQPYKSLLQNIRELKACLCYELQCASGSQYNAVC